jgi:hypothetical protein
VIQALVGDPFTLEVLVFLAMVLVGGVIVLEPDAALGWDLRSPFGERLRRW